MSENKELKKKYEEFKNDYKNYKNKKEKQYSYTDKDVSNMMKKMQGHNKKKDAHKLDNSKTISEQKLYDGVNCLNVGCYACEKEGELRTCTCEIPFFKEIIIMAFLCPHCGYKNVDVKIVGEVSLKGKKIILKAETVEDLGRDIFKSESARVTIPELGFEMEPGS